MCRPTYNLDVTLTHIIVTSYSLLSIYVIWEHYNKVYRCQSKVTTIKEES